MNPYRSLLTALIVVCLNPRIRADDYDSLRVQRKDDFEFAENPIVVRVANRATIRFTSKDYCDATIAIEDEQRRIIRHLASGVLGKNAPAPFQKNSLKQVVIWDGKNDQGEYVQNVDDMTVRVSLGLKPRLERTILWSPHRRFGGMPLLASGPDGVYVYDGRAWILSGSMITTAIMSAVSIHSREARSNRSKDSTGMTSRKVIACRAREGFIS